MDANDGKVSGFCIGRWGARGAMQISVLRTLFEAGYQPNLLVGTSI
jgi:hypothetical protein